MALDPIDGAPIPYAAMAQRIRELVARLTEEQDAEPVGLQPGHGAEAALLELACFEAGVPVLSLPLFLTDAQRRHAMKQSGASRLLTGGNATGLFSPSKPVALPSGTARITVTYGSTGNPKGICLSETPASGGGRSGPRGR